MTWTESTTQKEGGRDRLKAGDMVGEAFAIAAILIVLLFFLSNQVSETGLFTPEFQELEMALFYGSMLFGLVPPALRLLTRRRNRVRPFDVLGSIVFVAAAAYLLDVFPFDMSHLADLLPSSMKFVLDWVTDEIVMVLMGIGIAISLLVAVWTTFLYLSVKEWLKSHP